MDTFNALGGSFAANMKRTLILLMTYLLLGACTCLPKGEADLDIGIKDRGIASWYGEEFHGKTAANGEPFDMEAMTAAHRTLPLGSVVRVVNLINGKHVRVRINDRGPYVRGRILDLSYAAAAELDMVDGGISVIQLEVIGDHRPNFLVSEEQPEGVPLVSVLRDFPISHLERAHEPTRSMVQHGTSQGRGIRLPPTDVLHERRVRRVATILAIDHSVYTTVAALVLV